MKKFVLLLGLIFALAAGAFIAPRQEVSAAEIPAKYFTDTTEAAAMEDDEFSLIVIGDTQKAAEYYPEYIDATMDWTVANADALNLEYFITVGDIVDDVVAGSGNTDFHAQLRVMDNGFKKLENGGVPYALTLGNHDYTDMAYNVKDTSVFDSYFPLSRYEDWDSFGGAFADSIEYSYHLFSAGGTDYMIIGMSHHPTDEALAWANDIVAANPDRKVIVTNHGYIDAADTANDGRGTGTRTPRGNYMWNEFVSKHENIAMVFSGHEIGIEDGDIIRSVAYGENGNPVTQFMVNSQGTEFGGAGLIFIMRFRADGSVECSYYCPKLDMYYGTANQFTFYPETKAPVLTGGGTAVGTVSGGAVSEEYLAYSLGDDGWKDGLYAFENMQISQSGLSLAAAGSGQVTYCFEADEGSVLKALKVDYSGSFSKESTANIPAGVHVQVSADGISFENVWHSDAVGAVRRVYRLDDQVRGREKIYVRLAVSSDNAGKAALTALRLTLEYLPLINAPDSAGFGSSYTFSDYEQYDTVKWSAGTLDIFDMLIFDGYLGVGKQADYSGAKGWAIWRYDAGEGRTIETLSFNAAGRTIGTDMGWTIRVYVSTDQGETYTMAATEPMGSKTAFQYDLTNYVRGKDSFQVKLMLWGSYWHTVGLRTLDISGTYRFDINYHAGEGTAVAANPATYTASDNIASLAAPTPPQYYSFAGWYDNADFDGDALTGIFSRVGVLDLYAKYVPVQKNITYELSGGKNSADNPDKFNVVDGLTLAAPTRTGHSFGGWYADSGFTGSAVTAIAAGTDSDVTLHAKWLKNYRLTYVLNGGEMGDKRDSFTAEDSFDFGTPEREGYTFAGWYTDEALTESISGISPGRTENLIIYAKWTATGGGSEGCKSSAFGAAGVMLCGLLCLCTATVHRKRRAGGMKITDRNE